MTARDFQDRLPPEVSARALVGRVGIKPATWYRRVEREQELTPDDLAELKRALREMVEEARALIRSC